MFSALLINTCSLLDFTDGSNGQDAPYSEAVVQYPKNLTIRDLYFFMAVPTLCYELNFPRTSRIRKRFLLKRVVEVFVGMQVVLGLFQQWIIPSVRNSLDTFAVCILLYLTVRCFEINVFLCLVI